MMTRPEDRGASRVLLFAPHFAPGYKAGGALRSLVAIVNTAPEGVTVSVVTLDRDLDDPRPYRGLSGCIVSFGRHRVMYLNPRNPQHWWRLLRHARAIRPDLLYLNSLWNRPFSLVPALLCQGRVIRADRVLVAPRGQLGSGALVTGSRYKSLVALGWRGWASRPSHFVHCSDSREARQVRNAFPKATCLESMDPVELPLEATLPLARRRGSPLRAVYVGRVSRVKNLETLLIGLTHVSAPVTLRVIGLLEDDEYVSELVRIIQALPDHISVTFEGAKPPDLVHSALAESDLFCLPSLGENFGHVVAESLSMSCPVVAGPVTPFTNVLAAGGGELIENTSINAWTEVIQRWATSPDDDLNQHKQRAARAYGKWMANRDTSHIFDLALPPSNPSGREKIDFLTYSSRSGSTLLAHEIDRTFDVLVVPETQCIYHAFTIARGSRISSRAASRMIQEDRQIYWFDATDLALLSSGPPLTPRELVLLIGRQFAVHQGVALPSHLMFKLGGALHIWRQVRDCIPDARAINIERDGRAVINSAIRSRAPYLNGTTLALGDVVRAAHTWRQDHRVAQRATSDGLGVTPVRYEALLEDTQSLLDRLGHEMGWNAGGVATFAVNPAETAIHSLAESCLEAGRLQGWRSELRRSDRIVAETVCRKELAELGLNDFLEITTREQSWAVAVATARHVKVQAIFTIRRLRRIRNMGELRRKLVYRLKRV